MSTNTSDQQIKLRGSIHRVFYADLNFSAGTLITDEGATITFSGKFLAQKGQQVVISGSWVKHPRYGQQFKIDIVEHDLDFNKEGLINYLANHPHIKGIGPAKARLIVENLNDSFQDVLLNNPDYICEIAHVSQDTVIQLRNEWLKKQSLNSVLTYLSAFELTHHQITVLVEKYGSNCITILKENPYLIIKDVNGFGFKKVDRIARQLGTPKEHPNRIQSAIEYLLQEYLENGHCWIALDNLVSEADELLVLDCLNSKDLIKANITELIESGEIVSKSYEGYNLIALPFIYNMEEFLCDVFSIADRSCPHFGPFTDLEKSIQNENIELNEQQLKAVLTGLRKTISLITGMAGTGKSRSMALISTICHRFRLKVALAAPTGKAAKRMEELTGMPALTIHRLLGYGREGFARNEYDPIDAHVVLIDEIGMIDIPLAYHLFKAIDFDRTTVVLFGDPNQLPPIGPGNVLRDLVNTKYIPMVTLNSVVRQAGTLLQNCTAILKGVVHPTCEDANGKFKSWYVIDRCKTPAETQKFLLDVFRSDQLSSMGFDPIRDVQLLTPTHKGPIGTKELNIGLQRIIQKKLYDVNIPIVEEGRNPSFYEYDKVIQTRNNYDLGVMNGSIGQVVEVKQNGTVVIAFDNNNWIELKKGSEAIRDVQLAYCLTTHRTQGSEFPCVFVVVHSSHCFMLHRNLLYTGVTRAQKCVVIVGDKKGISYSAKHYEINNRHTFLPLMINNWQKG